MHVLVPKADHQGSKIPFTDFRWIGSYMVEKALPNNNYYLVRKFRRNTTQVLHRMRLRVITPTQPIPEVQTTSQEWKPDPEVIIKHDDLYARAWESENDKPIFENGQHAADSDKSPEITLNHELQIDETCYLPGTIQEDSTEIVHHTDEIGDGTDTEHHMEPDAEISSEHLCATNIKPRSTKHDLRHNPKPNCKDDYRFQIANVSRYGTRNNYVHHTWILVKCYRTIMEHLRTYP